MSKRVGRPPRLRVSLPDDTFDLTLGELEQKCSHRLWKGMRDEVASRRRLNQFVHLLGPNQPLTRIRRENLEDLQDLLLLTMTNRRGGTYSPSTVNKVMLAGSKAFNWALDNGYLHAKPKFPLMAVDAEKNAWIREQDVPRFAEFVMEHQGWRYAVALMTLLITGMRVGELTSLKAHQVEQEHNGLWFVRLYARSTKTKRARSVPIPAALARPLKEMLEDPRGVPSYRQLWRTCLSATAALGLPEKITPHVLRHTAATLMTRKGVPTATVARLLGHANIATTQRYDHWIPAQNPLSPFVETPVTCVPEIQPVPIVMPETYPKEEPNLHEQRVKWGSLSRSGGLGGNRTPVQGFAVAPAKHSITSNSLKSRDKPKP